MANIREAFEYAAKNPNSDFARNLGELAKSGSLDVEARRNGIDLTPFKPTTPKTPEVTSNDLFSNYDTEKYGIGPKVTAYTGGQQLGQGLAVGIRNVTGEINQTGNEEGQMFRDQQAVINELQKMRQISNTDPKKARLLNLLARMSGQTAVTQAEIDPGTTITDKQLLGDTLQLGTTLLGAGSLPGIVQAPGIVQGIKTGAKIGAGFGAVGNVAQGLKNNDSSGELLKQGIAGAAIGGATGGVLGGVAGGASDVLTKFTAKPQTAEDIAGMIAQGTKSDQKIVSKVLSSIDTTEVNRYEDLSKLLDTKATNIRSGLDLALDTDTRQFKLVDLTNKNKANYVEQALKQLKDYYKKTNAVDEYNNIVTLQKKALNDGLTVRDINNIARLHGKDLNAYNVNGQLASGLTKQAAENTRKGLKSTARTLFDNPIFEAADQQLSQLIKTKSLIDDVAANVTKLQQKVTERGFGENIGRLVFQVADKLTGGGLKGFIQSFVPRGEGLKTMNALDLERTLTKNLSLLEKLNEPNIKLPQIEKILNQIINPPKPASMVKVNKYNSQYPKYVLSP